MYVCVNCFLKLKKLSSSGHKHIPWHRYVRKMAKINERPHNRSSERSELPKQGEIQTQNPTF